MVGGPDGHRGSVTESSLVVRWTRGDSNLHREGEKVGCVTAETSSILACLSLAVGVVDNCGRPRRRLSPFLFEV
jgi:hypothetical protein